MKRFDHIYPDITATRIQLQLQLLCRSAHGRIDKVEEVAFGIEESGGDSAATSSQLVGSSSGIRDFSLLKGEAEHFGFRSNAVSVDGEGKHRKCLPRRKRRHSSNGQCLLGSSIYSDNKAAEVPKDSARLDVGVSRIHGGFSSSAG